MISMARTDDLFAKILSPVVTKHIESFGKGENGEVDLIRVMNLADNNEYDLICSAIIKSILTEYGDFVGKSFRFVAGTIPEGKNYRLVDIYEIEEEGE